MKQLITVIAAVDQAHVLENKGIEVEYEAETLKDAKSRAKYYLSEVYMHVCGATVRLGYAQVLINGECVADYFVNSKGKVI